MNTGSSLAPQQPESVGFSRDPAGEACLGGRRLRSVLEEAGGATPAYVYDLTGMRGRLARLKEAFGRQPHLVAFAMKANNAGQILREFHALGAGIDAVSGGELRLARRIGVPPSMIVFSGVAKTTDELDFALKEQIFAIQAESPAEVERIVARASATGRAARVTLRINPEVEIDSHAHISTGHAKAKFGIPVRDIAGLAQKLAESSVAKLVGLSTHVGSMLKTPDGYVRSARAVCEQAKVLRALGHRLDYINFGGGYGIDYGQGPVPEPSVFAEEALKLLESEELTDHTLVVEPGRSLVGPFGVLLASVVQTKASGDLNWLMIDAGMNDLMRPALYGAIHRIEALDHAPEGASFQVAGPVCESTDNFGSHILGPVPRTVVIRDAGAYGYAMANEYNGRPLPTEIFLDRGEIVHISRSLGVDDWVERRLR
jgi:diaminopimelate decarboxylase